MSVSLNSSQKLFDFYQNYISPASYNFSTIPETKASLQRVFEVFSGVYADPLSFCNLAAGCIKGSGGCEAICKSNSLQAVKLHTNQTNDYFTIDSTPTYLPHFHFNVWTPSKPPAWVPSWFIPSPTVIIFYYHTCSFPVQDHMDVWVKDGQIKSHIDRDLWKQNREPVTETLLEDATLNYIKSSLLNCSTITKTRISPSFNKSQNIQDIQAPNIQEWVELKKLIDQRKRHYEKMHNFTDHEFCKINLPEKAGFVNKPNPSNPQTATLDQLSTPTAQNVAKSSPSANQNGAPMTQTKKEEKQTPPDTQPANTASAQKKDLNADKASAQSKPDQTPEKRDADADSAKPNQNSSNQSQTNTSSSSNWLLGVGAVGGGAGLAGLYAWRQSNKRKAEQEKEAKLVGAIKIKR